MRGAHFCCKGIVCALQRNRLTTLPAMRLIYETMVRCTVCETYWERKEALEFKRQFCPCCGIQCRTKPLYPNGAARYRKALLKSGGVA